MIVIKKAILVLLIASIFIIACKKNVENNIVSTGLSGTWELREAGAGSIMKAGNYAAGNGNDVVFTKDSLYKRYQQKQISDSGNFHLVGDWDSTGQLQGNITFQSMSNDSYSAYFRMKEDTLGFFPPGIIYSYEIYVKVRN